MLCRRITIRRQRCLLKGITALKRVLVVLSLLFGLWGPAWSQTAPATPGGDLAGLDAVSRTIGADPVIQGAFGQCPEQGATPMRVQPFRDLSGDCAATPALCLAACLTGDGAHCFGLALALERREKSVYGARAASLALYAANCQAGDALACTNRAAGAMQGYPDDPLTAWAEPRRNQCTLGTMRKSCAANEAWGCAMLGLHLSAGIGAAPDGYQARIHLDRACLLAPGDGPCSMAKQVRARLDQQE